MDDATSGCCHVPHGCAFAKALQARVADCEHATRRQVGEATALDCRSPTAQANCTLLGSLLHERSRFTLRLGAFGKPLLHVQALRLQCGGLLALQRVLHSAADDVAAAAPMPMPMPVPVPIANVHQLVCQAQARHGSLSELPWQRLVTEVAAWTPRQRQRGGTR